MQELTEEEIAMVSGGDAAATHLRGQNAWGETVPGGATHYQFTGGVASYYASANRQRDLCFQMVAPQVSCANWGIAHMLGEAGSSLLGWWSAHR